MKTLELLFLSMRPYRWWRVGIVFLPLVLSDNPLNWIYILKICVAFAIFCLLTGSINVIDDIMLVETNKKDPIKRTMPVASGELSVERAEFATGAILVGAMVAAFFLGSDFGLLCVAYFFVLLSYFLLTKTIALLDSLTVATQISLCLVAGTVAIARPVSSWLLVFVFILSMFISFCERRRKAGLLLKIGVDSGPYEERSLDQLVSSTATFSLVIYTVYTLFSADILGSNLIYTVPFVLYGIYRLMLLTYEKGSDLVLEKLILKDYMLWGNVALWVVATVILARIF